MKLAGARVLVTGATGGLGMAIAEALHERGATLILTGRRVEQVDDLAHRCGADVHPCDLADRDQLEALATAAADADVLVANAGIPAGGSVLGRDVEALDRALDVNLRAPIVLARRLAPRMIARGGGHIVFMSSLSGKVVSPGSAVYSATKFGLRAFALGLREELRPHRVGVSTVFPGFIREAGMFATSGGHLPPGVGTRTPADVAEATIRAIERNLAEVDVAPAGLRAGAVLGGLLPEAALHVQRWSGAAASAESITAGQERDERRRRTAAGDGTPALEATQAEPPW